MCLDNNQVENVVVDEPLASRVLDEVEGLGEAQGAIRITINLQSLH